MSVKFRFLLVPVQLPARYRERFCKLNNSGGVARIKEGGEPSPRLVTESMTNSINQLR
jgi:hypothetical protein